MASTANTNAYRIGPFIISVQKNNAVKNQICSVFPESGWTRRNVETWKYIHAIMNRSWLYDFVRAMVIHEIRSLN